MITFDLAISHEKLHAKDIVGIILIVGVLFMIAFLKSMGIIGPAAKK